MILAKGEYVLKLAPPPCDPARKWDLFMRPCTKALLITTVSKWPPKSYQNELQNHTKTDTGWKVKTMLSSRREAHSRSVRPLRILSKPVSPSTPYQPPSFSDSREQICFRLIPIWGSRWVVKSIFCPPVVLSLVLSKPLGAYFARLSQNGSQNVSNATILLLKSSPNGGAFV